MKKEITDRYNKDFLVLLHDAHGFGDWFWFPSMSPDALVAWWNEQSDFSPYLYNPEQLPGDLYQAEDLEEEGLYLDLRLSGNYFKADIESPVEGILSCPVFDGMSVQQAIAA